MRRDIPRVVVCHGPVGSGVGPTGPIGTNPVTPPPLLEIQTPVAR